MVQSWGWNPERLHLPVFYSLSNNFVVVASLLVSPQHKFWSSFCFYIHVAYLQVYQTTPYEAAVTEQHCGKKGRVGDQHTGMKNILPHSASQIALTSMGLIVDIYRKGWFSIR